MARGLQTLQIITCLCVAAAVALGYMVSSGGVAIASVITGGGAHTKVWPGWLHHVTALTTLAVNLIATWKGIAVIEANVRLQSRLDAALRKAERQEGIAS